MPILRLLPQAQEINPARVGPPEQPRSPARATARNHGRSSAEGARPEDPYGKATQSASYQAKDRQGSKADAQIRKDAQSTTEFHTAVEIQAVSPFTIEQS